MVQSNHASQQSGKLFPEHSPEPSSLIVIRCKNKYQLEKAQAIVEQAGIATSMFFEPDWEYGNTAFATRPVQQNEREIFRKFRLWTI
jgi:hypothetical protein